MDTNAENSFHREESDSDSGLQEVNITNIDKPKNTTQNGKADNIVLHTSLANKTEEKKQNRPQDEQKKQLDPSRLHNIATNNNDNMNKVGSDTSSSVPDKNVKFAQSLQSAKSKKASTESERGHENKIVTTGNKTAKKNKKTEDSLALSDQEDSLSERDENSEDDDEQDEENSEDEMKENATEKNIQNRKKDNENVEKKKEEGSTRSSKHIKKRRNAKKTGLSRFSKRVKPEGPQPPISIVAVHIFIAILGCMCFMGVLLAWAAGEFADNSISFVILMMLEFVFAVVFACMYRIFIWIKIKEVQQLWNGVPEKLKNFPHHDPDVVRAANELTTRNSFFNYFIIVITFLPVLVFFVALPLLATNAQVIKNINMSPSVTGCFILLILTGTAQIALGGVLLWKLHMNNVGNMKLQEDHIRVLSSLLQNKTLSNLGPQAEHIQQSLNAPFMQAKHQQMQKELLQQALQTAIANSQGQK